MELTSENYYSQGIMSSTFASQYSRRLPNVRQWPRQRYAGITCGLATRALLLVGPLWILTEGTPQQFAQDNPALLHGIMN